MDGTRGRSRRSGRGGPRHAGQLRIVGGGVVVGLFESRCDAPVRNVAVVGLSTDDGTGRIASETPFVRRTLDVVGSTTGTMALGIWTVVVVIIVISPKHLLKSGNIARLNFVFWTPHFSLLG